MATERDRESGDLPEFYPEYGLVRPVVSFVFFYFLIDAVTVSLASRLARVYDGSLGDVGTVLAAMLWFALFASLRDVYQHQTQDTTLASLRQSLNSDGGETGGREVSYEGDLAHDDVVDRFLAPRRSIQKSLQVNGLRVVLGGLLVIYSWTDFLSRFGTFVAYIIAGVNRTTAMPSPIDFPTLVFWGILWVGGVVFLGRGLDRALVDYWRQQLYQTYRSETDAGDAIPE